MKVDILFSIAGAALLSACTGPSTTTLDKTSGTDSPPVGSPSSIPSSAQGNHDFTMLFSGFHNSILSDGLSVGKTTNLLFSLDLSLPVQTYSPPPGFVGEGNITPKILTAFELGSFCNGTSNAKDVIPHTGVAPGDATWVDHLSISMVSDFPVPADGGPPELEGPNAMCFGYRLQDGSWHWNLAPQLAKWDKGQQRYEISFPIQAGPVDTLKIMFNYGDVNRMIDKIVLVTKMP